MSLRGNSDIVGIKCLLSGRCTWLILARRHPVEKEIRSRARLANGEVALKISKKVATDYVRIARARICESRFGTRTCNAEKLSRAIRCTAYISSTFLIYDTFNRE